MRSFRKRLSCDEQDRGFESPSLLQKRHIISGVRWVMRIHKLFLYKLIVLFLFMSSVNAMVFDSRFIPLLWHPRVVPDDTKSTLSFELMAGMGNKALSDAEVEMGIPELYGLFDEGTLGQALTLTGKQNPLPPFLQGFRLPWHMEGKIQMQGISFYWYQEIVNWFAVGASWLAMRVNSYQNFFLLNNDISFPLTPSLSNELDDTRRIMFEEIGCTQNEVSQIGFGDIEMFLRFGNSWDYALKCRRIRAGLRFGGLFPTGEQTVLNAPASIPFGGNGHWGWYLAADGLFEVKEDIKVGILFQLIKRIPNTKIRRMPVLGEPSIFGAVVGLARVNPGVTLVFSPYFILENVRKGLGIGLQYTLTQHQEDSWRDMRVDKTIPVKLRKVSELSEWGSDYFTVRVLYDFGKEKVVRSFEPIFSLFWDIPASLFIGHNVPKTHTLSLGLEFSY